MTKALPGNLAEIFPLRLRLREAMRFQKARGHVITERVSDSQRFSLKPWQYEMLCRLDGTRSFETVAREVYGIFRGGFSSVGLLNFYRWLYQENLIVCESASVFELDETAPRGGHRRMQAHAQPANPFGRGREVRREPVHEPRGMVESFLRGLQLQRPWRRQLLKTVAIVLFGLAVIRLAYVIAPVLEPPVNRLYAEIENYFYEEVRPSSVDQAVPAVAESSQKELSLAGNAVDPNGTGESSAPLPEAAPDWQPELPVEDGGAGNASIGRPSETGESLAASAANSTGPVEMNPERLETLRRQLAECRIRRDEFYIQNNEEGYRREVAKMSELAKEIGVLESAQ